MNHHTRMLGRLSSVGVVLGLLTALPVWAQDPADSAPAQAAPAQGAPVDAAAPGPGVPVEAGAPVGATAAVASDVVVPQVAAPTGISAKAPDEGDGLTIAVSWTPSANDTKGTPGVPNPVMGYIVYRSEAPNGPFVATSQELLAGSSDYMDKVTTNPLKDPPKSVYYYKVVVRPTGAPVEGLLDSGFASAVAEGTPQGDWFDNGKLSLFLVLIAFASLMFYYTGAMRRGKELFIRRIPGIDAIEEAIGRATEMGKPILYVPGIDELQDIQTIASMLILGRVAEVVANYESDMIVPCTYPMVREVADEVVRAGYYMAGRPDSYDPKNVRFISSEQFAFCAGTNGIILRQKPAANLFLGRFFAESLIFAETGFINKSIQIAGTAEPTQLPFFVVSCDYTIIGEELFAVSAYLSKDPRLVSSLRASDIIKVVVIVSVIVGTALSSFGYGGFAAFWMPGGN